MKKNLSIVLALILAVAMICASAMADEVPQPEGGKKFESSWAITGMVVTVDYEEEGYRVFIDSYPEDGKGVEWSYSCYYHEEDDTLVSISSSKQEYTLDADDPDERVYAEAAYEGLDAEGTESVFSIDEHGHLTWKDGHENSGADLEFTDIGRFNGDWKNDAEGVYATFTWNGHEEAFYYDVFLQRNGEGEENVTVFQMTGVYNPETKKLECTGTVLSDSEDQKDEETYDAFFSVMDNGGLLFESGNGIELERDFDVQG